MMLNLLGPTTATTTMTTNSTVLLVKESPQERRRRRRQSSSGEAATATVATIRLRSSAVMMMTATAAACMLLCRLLPCVRPASAFVVMPLEMSLRVHVGTPASARRRDVQYLLQPTFTVSTSSASSLSASSTNGSPDNPDGASVDASCTTLTGIDNDVDEVPQKLNKFQARMVRLGLQLYIVGMCVALPATLLPQRLLRKLGLVSVKRSQIMALSTGQFCSRWLLRLIPFCKIRIYKLPRERRKKLEPLEPSIWVCNHISMLDVFVLLGVDRQLRGKRKRPIKIVYWKGLEANPITRLLFRQAGFIPVQMADNGNGNDNEYDVSSFKQLLKDAKEAFADGFDIGVLPEGQLNPTPEKGLLPVFSGAYTLAKLSKRPIRMMALYGTNHLWDALDGMCCTSRVVKVKAYPHGRKYKSAHDFVEAFTNVVGTFGKRGYDLPEPELTRWLTGEAPASGAAASATTSAADSSAIDAAAAPPVEPSSKQSA